MVDEVICARDIDAQLSVTSNGQPVIRVRGRKIEQTESLLDLTMRINLFGASGAGCSTLGEGLSTRLKCDLFDNDTYYWEHTTPPFTTKVEPQQRNSNLLRDLQSKDWVLAGSVNSWKLDVESLFSLAILVRLPPETRMDRINVREVQRYGDRILPGGDMHERSVEFIEWARSYDSGYTSGPGTGRNKAQHEAYFAALQCPKFEFWNVGDFEQSLDRLMKEIVKFSSSEDDQVMPHK